MRWVSERIRGDRRPSKFRFTRKADALARMLPHFDFSKNRVRGTVIIISTVYYEARKRELKEDLTMSVGVVKDER